MENEHGTSTSNHLPVQHPKELERGIFYRLALVMPSDHKATVHSLVCLLSLKTMTTIFLLPVGGNRMKMN